MEFHVSLSGRKNLTGQIYRQIRQALADGRLRAGDGLPPGRVLADSLGVSRTTVSEAYDRLAGEGFLAPRIGSGTYVSKHVAQPARSGSPERRTNNATRPRSLWQSIPL